MQFSKYLDVISFVSKRIFQRLSVEVIMMCLDDVDINHVRKSTI